MPQSWIFKSEPSTYSWDDLVRDKSTRWDGVANATALINLRATRVGDEVLFYHSGDGKAIVGIARVRRAAYADPRLDDPRRVVVDIEAVRPLKAPVTLAAVKAEPELARLPLVRISRLSVSPVAPPERAILRRLGVR